MTSKVWLVRFLLVAVFLISGTWSREPNSERNSTRNFLNVFGDKNLKVPPGPCYCSCGLPNEDTRIVGGKEVQPHQFPWQARLSYMNRFYCGGTLINDKYLITAAHCLKGFIWFLIKVTFGEHDRCAPKSPPETRFVARAFLGNFSFANFEHDIALLRLNERVYFSDTIRPICLPKIREKHYGGSKAIASGWGTLYEDGKPSCVLQSVDLPVMTLQQCHKSYYSPRVITDNMLCAGYQEGKKDACQGDSGGPLVTLRKDNKYELIGIVSWGNGCARKGYPGIYTRVTNYMDFIMKNSRDGCFCDQD